MPRPRTVIDLLAEQGEDELTRMREAAVRERDRFAVEVQQIDEALALRKRSQRGGTRSGALTQETVLSVSRGFPGEFSPAELATQLGAQGYEASPNAIRNHLRRLAER